MSNKYAGLESLRIFLAKLKTIFASITHKHTVSDLTDYTVDTALSSTSTNPVQNKVLDTEFNAISDAMGALDLAIDGKAPVEHAHSWSDLGESVTNLGDTLTWDGNTEGKVSVVQYVGGNPAGTYVKVSDAVLTREDFANGATFAINGNENAMTVTWEQIEPYYTADYLSLDYINFVGVDNYTDELGITYPESGIYFANFPSLAVTSLTIPGYNFTESTIKPVPEKYLPSLKGVVSAEDLDAVPTTRKINGKDLSSDITLSMSDMNGTVPITKGGTGATTVAAAATNLGVVSYSNSQSLTDTQKNQARNNIGAVDNSQVLNVALTAGISTHNAISTSVMENVIKMQTGQAVDGDFIRLSEKIPTMNDLNNGFALTMSFPSESSEIIFEEQSESIEVPPGAATTVCTVDENGLINIGELLFIVPSANELFPAPGVWGAIYITKFRINCYDFNDGGGISDHTHIWGEIISSGKGGDTLAWSGIIGDKASAHFTEETNDVISDITFYKVSEEAPDVSVFNNGYIIKTSLEVDMISGVDIQSNVYPNSNGELKISNSIEGNGYVIGELSVIVVNNPGTLTFDDGNSITFAEKGLYFPVSKSIIKILNNLAITTKTRSLTIPGFTGFPSSILPLEFLPYHKHNWSDLGETDGGSDTLTWDGNTDGLLIVAQNEASDWVKISDCTFTVSNLGNGGSYTLNDGPVYKITSSSAQTDSNGIIMVGSIICVPKESATKDLPSGIYFIDGRKGGQDLYVTSLTINGYTGFPIINKIPEKYLPDYLSSNASSKQLSFHGITTTGTEIAYEAEVPGIDELVAGVTFIMIPHVTCTGNSATLNVNGLGAKDIKRRKADNISYYMSCNAGVLSKNYPMEVMYDGKYWVILDASVADVSNVYGKLPISSGGTGATTAESALTNLGAAAINHSHNWSDIGVTITETLVISDAQITGTYHAGFYLYDLDVNLFPDEFDSVLVTFDGVEYNCPVTIDEGFLFGNLSKFGIGGDTGEPFVMQVAPGEYAQLAVFDGNAHVISMTTFTKNYIKIPVEYLPDEIGGGSSDIDTALSATSTNPVQNKVVNAAIENLKTYVNTQIGSAIAASY